MEKASYRNMLERELRKELEDGIATCGSLPKNDEMMNC